MIIICKLLTNNREEININFWVNGFPIIKPFTYYYTIGYNLTTGVNTFNSKNLRIKELIVDIKNYLDTFDRIKTEISFSRINDFFSDEEFVEISTSLSK